MDPILQEQDLKDQEHEEQQEQSIDVEQPLEQEKLQEDQTTVSKEELEYFYTTSQRRSKKKRNTFFKKYLLHIISFSVIFIIITLFFLLIKASKSRNISSTDFSPQTNETQLQPLLETIQTDIEQIEKQFYDLEKEIEQLRQENIQLREQVEELQNAFSNLSPISQSSSMDSSINPNQFSKSQSDNQSNKESTYIVKKGDTLWKISEKMYGKGEYYTKIIESNGLEGENSIYEGMKLTIPSL